MPRELMSSFGETNAALEGQRGHILVANHHEEGLLPRTAATAGHPLLDPRHQQPRCFGLASLRPRASRWSRVQAFSLTYPLTTYSAPRRPFPTGCPSFSIGQSKVLSPCLCWFWFSAAAPRPDPLGQFLPHQEHHPTDCFTDLYDLLRLFSSTITPPTRQDALWLSPHHILTFFFLTDNATSCQMAALMTTTTTWTTTRPIFIDNNFNLRELVPKSRGFHFARGPGIRLRGHQLPEPASCSTRRPHPRRARAPETARAKRPTYPLGESKQ